MFAARGRSLTDSVSDWISGASEILPTVVMLILAWSLSAVLGRLGTANYLVDSVSGGLPAVLMPMVIFLVCCVISFATGSFGCMESKQVNLWKSVLFTVCSILVLDTFVAPAIIGVSSITIWIITAILFFIPYGLLSAELGSTYPDDGGIYSWVNRAFGEKTAVMVGWYYWVNVAFWMPAVFIAFAYWMSYTFFPDANNWVLCIVAVIMPISSRQVWIPK